MRVAAAVILRPDGRVLLAQRPPGKPYEGYWEFPGGKLEPGEAPAHALARELHEELGLDVRRSAPWIVQEFVYPHAHVELNFFRVFDWDGEPHGHDGQAFAWQTPGAFDVAPLLPANTRVLAALQLPVVYGISCASDIGEDAFLARAESAFASGLAARADAREGMARGARQPTLRCAMKRGRAPARREGDAQRRGRHRACTRPGWRPLDVRTTGRGEVRPEGLLVGASCHDAHELARAAALGCDFAVMGPVQPTPTHAGRPAARLGRICAARSQERGFPCMRSEGSRPRDLTIAVDRGAHGLAMRRGAW